MQIAHYESNARFAKKSLKLEYATLNALVNYYENGGTITVCPPGKHKDTFRSNRGSIAYHGFRAENLKAKGLSKANNA